MNGLEQRIWEAFPTGTPVTADRDGEREVRGEVLTRLLLGAQPPAPGARASLRLHGAVIIGEFALRFAQVDAPILLEDCEFERRPVINWARLGFTSFARSTMPGLHASNVTVEGHLKLNEARVDGELRMPGARISGGLVLDRARIRSAGVAVQAERIIIGGDLAAGRADIEGLVIVSQGRISGDVDLDRARCVAPAEPETVGEPHALLAGDRGVIGADSLVVEGGFFARGATFDGELRMWHSRISGAVSLTDSTLTNPGRVAMRLDSATLDGGLFIGHDFSATGEIRAVYAQISRTFALRGARLSNPGGSALRAASMTLQGTLDARGSHLDGLVHLDDSVLNGPASFVGATLTNPGGVALAMNGVAASSTVNLCDGFSAVGQVQLSGSRIGSVLCLDLATLTASPDPADTRRNAAFALRLWRTQVPELRLRITSVTGPVDLRHARVGLLRDDPASWPEALHLTGLTYETLEPPATETDRRAWLARDPAKGQRQPYEQLAAVLRAQGDDDAARSVLLTRQRAHTRSAGWASRAWGVLQDVTVGYGYRPMLAALWLVVLLGAGTAAYSAHPPRAAEPGKAPEFHAVVYTLDVLLPLVDFGQQSAFVPAGRYLWLSYLLIAAGWILATTIAAALTRSLRRT
ncbi:hypothetical protein [Catenuloplanes atrovinosus]|uniref:Membrane-associated oxidoreductase n=1 Tax=Catenuloplanes atrovinosus TaxID=137266 RepID=A0AAE3YHE2_9ACTN|nr:hypothetical protein [Catenuloplanes atrovinosus]MDR7273968.1 hypothetical protein [Catenuloplanes atrovinosus]